MFDPRGGYSRSRGYNPIRGRQTTRSTSQNLQSNFRPKTEWKEEDAALVLLVHLPGFLKEQITVTTNESTSYIRIYGERMLINNIRRRFNTGYNIPKNCNLNEMKWEFSGGILTIRIPKIIPAVQRTSPRESDATASDQDVPKPEMEGGETPQRRTSTSGKDVEAIGPQKAANESVSQKGQDESPQKAKLLAKELDEESTAEVDGEKVGQNVIEKKEQKPIEEEKCEKIEESEIAENVVLKKMEDEEKSETAANKTICMEFKGMESASSSTDKDIVATEKELEEEKKERAVCADKGQSNKDMENGSASANKSEKDSGMVINDKNVLILNICVGVSVVMALGANLYVNFSSSRKT